MTSDQTPFQPFDEMIFSDTQCFLCGQLLEDNKSREHVFPKWILSRFNLWNQNMTLLNGTQIPYRNLTIPCCLTCNNEHLARLEQIIESAFQNGIQDIAAVDRLLLYQWTGKIFYGLLYRELSLSLDRSHPEYGTITSPDIMQDYRTLHAFLQSSRNPVEFENFSPGSVFIFQIETVSGVEDFDYTDNFVGMTFCIRMGNIGIISCLKDDGMIQDSLSELYEALKSVKLHPIQFDELCAIVFYNASLMVRPGKYLSITPSRGGSAIVKTPGFSLKPVFDEWDDKVYARFLEEFWSKWGLSYDEIFFPPNSVRTYLSDYT